MIGASNVSRMAYPRPPQSGSYPAEFTFSNDFPLFGSPAIKKTANDSSFMTFRRGFSNYFPTATEIRGQGTVEFWVLNTATRGNNTVLWDIQEVSTEVAMLQRTGSPPGISARARFGATTLETAIGRYAVNTWTHAAFTLDDNRYLTMWMAGNRVGTVGNGDDTLVTSGGNWWRLGTPTIADGQAAYYRELRVSTIPRYDRNNTTYTVPTGPFVNDADTHMLFHLDGSDETAIPQLVDDIYSGA
jgi:hypothetical protein